MQYYYWTQGVACSEVELDLLTGDHTVLCSDIMMVSDSHTLHFAIAQPLILTFTGHRAKHQPRS